MKRMILRLIIALVTFCLGAAGFFLWWKAFPPTVTLCQLAQNPDLYRGQIIKVEADAVGGFGIIISDDTCPAPKYAGVWMSENYKPNATVQSFYDESKTENYKARILVTGQYDPEGTRGCFTPHAVIHATNIEFKSEIKAELINQSEE